MQDVLNNSPNIPLAFTTNTSTARLRMRPVKDWQFEVKGSMRERSGVKPYAMTFGFSTAIEIPEPIHQQMVDGDAILNYQKNDFKLMASGGVSVFNNHISTLYVDNPKRITDISGGDGPKTGALDLYPDNRVVRGSVAMAYLLPHRTALAGTFAMSEGTQDDPFLRAANNSAIVQSSRDSLPAQSLKGKVNTIAGDVRLASSPMDKLEAAARFHYTKYDNKTPSNDFTGFAPYDVSWQRWVDLANEPANNSQMTAGGDLDYALSSQIRVGGTAEYRIRERTIREVEKDKETVLGGRARLRPFSGLQIDGKYTHGDRKQDAFNPDDYLGNKQTLAIGPYTGVYDSLAQVEQADLRRFDVANRVQDKGQAGLAYAIGERADMSASYAYAKDDYKDSKMGLTGNKEHTVAATGTFHLSDRLDLSGAYGFDWMRSNQASRQSGTATLSALATDNWTAELSDNDNYVQAGFEWEARPGKVTISGDYQFSRHFAKFHFTNGTNTAVDVPSTIYRLHQAIVEARYNWMKATTVALRYGFEEYDTNDWAVTNVPFIFPLVGASTAVFLGDSSQGYRAHRVALMMKHTF
jgi:MtrB/PioB family decaheme-associated outer membrane protein